MSVLKKIVVGHDLRGGGEVALQSAVVLARRCNAALKLVHVVEPYHLYQKVSHPSPLEAIAERAGKVLEARLARSDLARLQVQYEVCTGKPFVELIVARRAWRADVIVVGGSAHPEDHVLGSTGERVIRKAFVPVLVTRKPLKANPSVFLMPTDFSPGAKKAANEAIVLAENFGARIYFLHVLDAYPFIAYAYREEMFTPIPLPTPEEMEPEWESFFSGLPLGKIAWEKHTDEGSTANTIIRHAETMQADLIVMGTHGRTGLEHMLMGSVAEKVARSAPCALLTVRPEALQFKLP